MSADAPIVSRPFHPKMACPACVWGRGEHADWCHPSNATVTFTVEAKWPSTEQQSGITQTYFTATEQQNQAYERMVAARMMNDKTSAITAAVRIAAESLPNLPKEPWMTIEQQAEMRRGLSVEYKPKE